MLFCHDHHSFLFQSTLLMRGATPCAIAPGRTSEFQSTLLMRGATLEVRDSALVQAFQSTLLMRGATGYFSVAWMTAYFNPRSSCEERQWGLVIGVPCRTHFNPRSSCEERLICTPHIAGKGLFQSTLLMRGATPSSRRRLTISTDFNPRSSCEERLCHFQALICLTSSYIFREPSTSFQKHSF